MPSRVDPDLIRRRDRKPVGTLTIIRTNHPAFTDERGGRRSNPTRIAQLLALPPMPEPRQSACCRSNAVQQPPFSLLVANAHALPTKPVIIVAFGEIPQAF